MRIIAIDPEKSRHGKPGVLFLKMDRPVDQETRDFFLRLWEKAKASSHPDLPEVSFAENGLKVPWDFTASPGYLGELISNLLSEAVEKLSRDRATETANQKLFLEKASSAFGLPLQ